MFETSPVFLDDLETGKLMPAELVQGIGDAHIEDWHNAWQPALGAIKAALKAREVPKSAWPQSSHWNWAAKVNGIDDVLGYRAFCVTAGGMTQAMMRIDLTKTSRLDETFDKPLVYIDYLEVAPWNQSFEGTPKKYRGAGPILLVAAAALSMEEGFSGRIGLHSLPQSEEFYEKKKMIRIGRDPKVQNLHYYEMTFDVAAALVAEE